jgi:aminoglycoside phosphotransferase (APT) family kinase protein
MLRARVDNIGLRVRCKGDRTLVHGDFKTSNIFFTSEGELGMHLGG